MSVTRRLDSLTPVARVLVVAVAIDLAIGRWWGLSWLEGAKAEAIVSAVGLLALCIVAIELVRALVTRTPGSLCDWGDAPRHPAFEGALPPPVARALAAELETWRSLLGRAARRELPDKRFSSLRGRAEFNFVVAIWVMLAIEVPVVHLILGRWIDPGPGRELFRWGLAAASLYGGLWLVADLRRARRSPGVAVEETALVLDYGVRAWARIEWARLAGAEALAGEGAEAVELRKRGGLRLTIMSAPNLRLRLRTPVVVHGAFGTQREVEVIDLFVADPEGLLAALAGRAPVA